MAIGGEMVFGQVRASGGPTRSARRRGDGGLSLIEVVIAIALIAIIVVPASDFIIQAEGATSQQHLRLEASNVATSYLERLQALAAQGQLPTQDQNNIQVSVRESGNKVTTFTVDTSFSTVAQGTNQSICSSGAGVLQQIWLVTATVTWRVMDGGPPIQQATEIAPAQAGAIQQDAGELGIRLSLDGTSTNLFTSNPPGVQATVTGQWLGGGSHTAPAGEFDSEGPLNSGKTGCIVFQDLDVTPGMVYTVSFAGNQTLVTDQEYSDTNPTGPLTIGPFTLQPGRPNIQTVLINKGTTVDINYTGPIVGPSGTCPTSPSVLVPPPTSSPIPISIENSFLTSFPNKTWVAASSTGITSLLLFPWPSTTQMWAGDQPDSLPTSVYGTSGPAACAVDDTAGGTPGGTVNVYLPLYRLTLKVTGAPTVLTATEVAGGGRAFALNTPLLASSTSIPLGEYSLSDQAGPLSPRYAWVTPTGECTDTAVNAAPPAKCISVLISVTAP